MNAEIIAIGSELTSGAKLDTNSQWLSVELSEIGIPVKYHSTMADDRDAMLEVFRTAANRSDLVLVTGGLGPTLDDLTRELLAELTGTELVLDEPSLAFIRDMFEKRGRVMPERNDIQAKFPAGSTPLPNPIGTAPGIWCEVSRDGRTSALFAAMPGVPSEMKRMFAEQVRPRLPGGQQVIRRLDIHCFGQGESAIEEMLGDLTARGRNPEVGITASKATITLRIAAQADSIDACNRMLAESRQQICATLGDLIFGEQSETLEGTVLKRLAERGQTVAIVDAGTFGLICQMAAATPHSATSFSGGTVVGTALKYQAGSGTQADLVTEQSARQMAIECRESFGSSFALAITPYSEPDGDDGLRKCYLALAGPDICAAHEHQILNDMSIAGPRAAKTAFNMLRRHLLTRE
ncbi:CinA family nicotinamide mononucleotide deamidase-related protein [bacterium]|nr:CinA family nicotinamide mononucleotide deamidase-related protein [bacterium]